MVETLRHGYAHVKDALNCRVRDELVSENDSSENPACRASRVFRYSDFRLIHLSETGEVVPVLALFVRTGENSKSTDLGAQDAVEGSRSNKRSFSLVSNHTFRRFMALYFILLQYLQYQRGVITVSATNQPPGPPPGPSR
jgi:hypothetical protein